MRTLSEASLEEAFVKITEHADLNGYKLKIYPTAWAIIDDSMTGVPRYATREELHALGLTGPGNVYAQALTRSINELRRPLEVLLEAEAPNE